MSNKKVFTVEEIRNYIASQDSLGDVAYNLTEENIVKANIPEQCCPECESTMETTICHNKEEDVIYYSFCCQNCDYEEAERMYK